MSEVPPTNPVDPTPTPGGPTVPVDATMPVADAADVEKNKIMAVLAYLGLLVLIPIFAAKNSPFARYHSNQGLLLLIVSFVGLFAIGILGFIVALIPFIRGCACAIFPLMGVFWLAIMAFIILGIVNAATGKMKPLPVIGKYRILK